MAADEQYAQALRDVARLERYAAALEDSAFKLLEWDRDRNFIVPYRVRDPIIAALNSKDATPHRVPEAHQSAALPDLYLSKHEHGNLAGKTVVAELATGRIVGVLAGGVQVDHFPEVRKMIPDGAPGTFACPICGVTTPHHHTEDEVQAARLMALSEAEVDAELRRLGIHPDEAARQGKAAVDGALQAIHARTSGVGACWCASCNPGEVRMFVCPGCGCKRCPRADSHEAACTGKLVPANTPSGVTHTCSGCEENRARLDAVVQAALGVEVVQPASTECQHNPSTGSCQHQPWCRINNECNQHFNASGVGGSHA